MSSMPKANAMCIPLKKTGLSTASLVCGLVGLAYPSSILILVSIAGVICGHMAFERIRKNPEDYNGLGRAKTGIIISYIALTLGLMIGTLQAFLQISIKDLIQGGAHTLYGDPFGTIMIYTILLLLALGWVISNAPTKTTVHAVPQSAPDKNIKRERNVCVSCGESISADVTFCEACGAKLAWNCSECGREIAASKRFCGACGTERH